MPEEDEPSPPIALAPSVLSYAARLENPTSKMFFAGSLLLAVIFGFAAWTVEADFFSPTEVLSGPPSAFERLERRRFEHQVLWPICAAGAMCLCLPLFGPQRGFRLDREVVATALLGAVVYCVIPWALRYTPFRPSRPGEFFDAMLLAALAGIGTSIVRSKSKTHS